MYYTSDTTISQLTRIRRQRILPRPGDVLVEPGDHVESSQVVARASLPGDFRIVPVARLLGVSAAEAEDSLQVDLGSTIHREDIIAKQSGLFGQAVESPIDGVITAKGGGRVLIEAQTIPFELHAHIPGTVLNVEENQLITIETAGALIEGVWGRGDESVGVVKCMTKKTQGALQASTIDPSCHGSVLVAGLTVDREPLIRAQDVEARGIVTGGLSPELLPLLETLSFPVVVTDGLGNTPMTGEIFDLLKEYEGREASISGKTEFRWRRKRPEIIIPLPSTEPPVDEADQLKRLAPGARVRIVRPPHKGSVGTVLDIPRYARRTRTGTRAHCAEVDIGQDEAIFVPLVNLDILR